MADPKILFQVRKGAEVDLPVLLDGEFGWCQDSKKLFIGSNSGNQYLGKYDPAAPAIWSGAAPTTTKEAIDRLAAAVNGLLGGVIP